MNTLTTSTSWCCEIRSEIINFSVFQRILRLILLHESESKQMKEVREQFLGLIFNTLFYRGRDLTLTCLDQIGSLTWTRLY